MKDSINKYIFNFASIFGIVNIKDSVCRNKWNPILRFRFPLSALTKLPEGLMKLKKRVLNSSAYRLHQKSCSRGFIDRHKKKFKKRVTLSFILQLCANALEPSIFSKCLFFMKVKGSFQSFMSASSSSARPTAGEWSKSESIFMRALWERAYVSRADVVPQAAGFLSTPTK